MRTTRSAASATALVMRDQHDGLAARVQAAQQLDDLLSAVGVQRPGGLVGEHQRRLVRQRPGDGEPLALPAGQHAGDGAVPCR